MAEQGKGETVKRQNNSKSYKEVVASHGHPYPERT